MITLLAFVALQTKEAPKLITRKPVPYVSIRTTETMKSLSTVFPRLMPKIRKWAAEHHLKAGPDILRYRHVDMEKGLDIEIGVEVDKVIKGEKEILTGKIPGGQYVSLVHMGSFFNLVPQNAAVQAWAKEQGLTFKMLKGEEFASRVEFYYTDPDQEPDMSKWKSEVLYMVNPPKKK